MVVEIGVDVLGLQVHEHMHGWHGAGQLAVRPIGEPMNSHTNSMLMVTFSSDGQILVSTGSDATRRLWPPRALTAWPSMVCAKLTRNMSNDQWRHWVSQDIGYIQLCPGLPQAPDDGTR